MSPTSTRTMSWARGAAVFAFCSLSTLATVHAAEPMAFTIAPEEGYGVADCMRGTCGESFATAWCEAHGHVKAVAFGLAADVTGMTPVSSAAAIEPGSVVIRCGD